MKTFTGIWLQRFLESVSANMCFGITVRAAEAHQHAARTRVNTWPPPLHEEADTYLKYLFW